MSIFHSMFGVGADPASAASPAPAASPAAKAPASLGDTESVRRIAARLDALPPERARFLAAFAYLLARAANVDLAITDAEAVEMTRVIAEVGGLDADTAALVIAVADTRAEQYGATDDYLVTREFKSISTPEDREHLLRCCLLVAAADSDIDANESWLVNRIAEELDVPRADLNRIRDEFTDKIAGLAELRRMRAAAEAEAPAASETPAEMPDGVKIEQVWLVEVPYTPQAPELRPALRHQHLARMMRLKVQDRVIEVGGTADFAKSVILVRASSEDEIRELVAADVYTTGGVWGPPVIVGYGRLVLGE
jgi:uncharacterized tellurite resistance protein B-like protein/uncharacterized protein YciI